MFLLCHCDRHGPLELLSTTHDVRIHLRRLFVYQDTISVADSGLAVGNF